MDGVKGECKRGCSEGVGVIKFDRRIWFEHCVCEEGTGEIIQKPAGHKFMLAVDPKFPWVEACLK